VSAGPIDQPAGASSRRRLLAILPLIVVVALGALFFARLFAGDASKIPSALLGQGAPPIDLPGLDGAPGLTDADLRQGHVSIVNVFGSWCPSCLTEHESLMALAADKDLAAKGVRLYGLAQKDNPENLRRFLGAKGDPYAKIGLDPDGRVSIDWGVYGAPETFIVKGDGTIAYKFIGPIDADSLAGVVRPEIDKAMN
jgi:cytochrome c biogenesis protein CcmG, thiol:disulfide interchange protein DsbE